MSAAGKPEPLPPLQTPPPPSTAPSLNHGGPGICRLCHPHGAPPPLEPIQQGELLL